MERMLSKIGVIGLGYVGLPLAVEFAKHRPVIGYDLDQNRITELKRGNDICGEVSKTQLENVSNLQLTYDPQDLIEVTCFIVTVPTPIDSAKNPDLTPLVKATRLVAEYLKAGDLVIYESTVFPGCTEEICVPILEEESGLKFNQDFFCGYSPERINPGDKDHRLTDIAKVTSGSTSETAQVVDDLYSEIIVAGTFKASSIKVAEAAKVIENTQRDLNIALMNELSVIFDLVGIDTQEVLEAAASKWNFLRFTPGLVGGHCIGVDPYYLTRKAQDLGYAPKVILAGREINDRMGSLIVNKANKLLSDNGHDSAQILLLGLTFKENCPDIRNSKSFDVYHGLCAFGHAVDAFDPIANRDQVFASHGLEMPDRLAFEKSYDLVLLLVGHQCFIDMGPVRLKQTLKANGLFFDVKALFDKKHSDWRL